MTPVFVFNSTKQSMTWTKYEKILKSLRCIVVYHPTEHVTVDSLIADFTAWEDSIDDVCDRFQDMVKHSKNETNEKLQTQTSVLTTIRVPNVETGEETPIVDAQEQTPAVAVGSSASPQQISHLSRPKIKIAPYDENPLRWNTWFGLFKTLIHDQAFSNVEKNDTLADTKNWNNAASNRWLLF